MLGNADLLDRALGNLLGNAIKFSPANSQVTLTTRRVGAWVRLEIEDQGPGITATELPRLFSSFQRTRDSEQSRKPGSGLGLKFVKPSSSDTAVPSASKVEKDMAAASGLSCQSTGTTKTRPEGSESEG